MAHTSRDRWGGTAAAIALATALSGCQLLTLPLEWAGKLASFLVSAFGEAAPLAAMAAMAKADGTALPPHPLEGALERPRLDGELPRATAESLARGADGARALVLVDLADMTMEQARYALRRLAACGPNARGIALVDGAALLCPRERAALADALAATGTTLVEWPGTSNAPPTVHDGADAPAPR